MDESRIKRLNAFAEFCKQHITGDEKGEAQIFLDRLFQAFGQQGCLEVGGTPEFRIRKSKEDGGGTAFADYVWKPVVLIEMKKRGADLNKHYRQAFDYWIRLVPNRPKYVILCNFDEFWIYDFDVELDIPLDQVKLTELPERYGPLAFLFPTQEKPTFKVDRVAVTQHAADLLAGCYGKLVIRSDVGPQKAQRFILQILVALFSEDIGLLPKYFVTQLLDDCIDPPTAFDLLNGLFVAMNSPKRATGGRFKDIPYFNGGLFQHPTPIELGDDEIARLKKAADEDWSHISPHIFGTIFQHSMDDVERHKYGGHYTTPTDIMKIVGPTIVQPWRTMIERADTLKQLRALQQRLHTYRVLDPACGSGNFLYLAYRELKRIEALLHQRIDEISTRKDKSQKEFGVVTAKQFFGLDITPFAVELAKVTMTLAHKLAIDELHIEENALPLDNLDDNIQCIDALIDWPIDGSTPTDFDPKQQRDKTPWPKTDVIIGNPPFLGAKRLKPERGADYVNAVRKRYPDVPGMADYCVYWIRRTHDNLQMCIKDDPLTGRAGLVGTQNIRNNKSRVGGLDHVVKSGTIIEAVDNQPWSGEANVHVSIANWVKHLPLAPSELPGVSPDEPQNPKSNSHSLLIPQTKKLWHKVDPSSPLFDPPPEQRGRKATTVQTKRGTVRKDKSYELAFRECKYINSALSDQPDISSAKSLLCNTINQKCFQGVVPGYDGFRITHKQRTDLILLDSTNAQVSKPWLIGRDLVSGTGQPSRSIIDFNSMDLLKARKFSEPFDIVENNVLPAVRQKARNAIGTDMVEARKDHLERWWKFWNVRSELRRVLNGISRYIAISRVTKRPIFCFVEKEIVPDGAIQVFALNDDYSMGIIQSDVHWQWFLAKCSKLAERLRYTRRSVWDTFPWPQSPTVKQINRVAEAGRAIRRIRGKALENMTGGLRALYRTLELPGKNPLGDAHAELDAAVLAAYGFDPKGDLLAQLLELNLNVAKRIENDEPVISPGIPPNYPNPENLITKDCIRPK